ncbi:ComF family protein [Chryseolinea sp. T2]|uniref:ComF family protein n=1 Tax=Chryseolinea sp. T2 TaxID=3129255 RepID=UPI003076DA74
MELPETDYHCREQNALLHRLSYRMPLRYGMACYHFTKNGRIQHLLHQLKYKNQPEIGVRLGVAYGDKLRTVGIYNFDLVVPVPLHTSRLRKRGYNQAAKFGEGLSKELMIPQADEALVRMHKTETQTKKSRVTRWENIANAFRIALPEIVKDRSILLVDDVITTGSTLEACVQALLSAGPRDISVACIAEA